ncbi:MAG: glycosyltransferase family 2 protein [Deltaproteobacteria bacterium]|nr:glycosyltransferase family 2 protein [Deltaproteobacteria bacterium]
MPENKPLAIVIPAYKAKFLEAALGSILAQTIPSFRVYVGDDCSPENIEQICNPYSNHLDLIYNRFEDNIGQTSLVKHWNRCIRLSSEPWVWLFSDDDIMEPECVETFLDTRDRLQDPYTVYRFNTLEIDTNENVTRINPPHPQFENGIRFAYHRLISMRASYVSEFIFSRYVFERTGGMIDFPMAWCTDDASLIAFAGDDQIVTMQGPKVHWRNSGINISSKNTGYQDQKIEASFQYIQWLNHFFAGFEGTDLEISIEKWNQCQKNWIYRQLEIVSPVSIKNIFKLANRFDEVWNDGSLKKLLKIFFINLKFLFQKEAARLLGRRS